MALQSANLTFKQAVMSPLPEAYRAFTNATALRDWLCDVAESDPRKGGRLYLWWDSGFWAAGRYETADSPRRLAFSWHGKDDPEPTRVRVSFAPHKGGTLITLHHDGVGSGRKWADTRAHLERDWPASLENLKSMLETGQDLRVLRRPLLGIFGEPLTAAVAERLGIQGKAGVRLEGVAEGSGAQAAGLQKDDVLVGLGGVRILGFASFQPALATRQGGDTVKVAFYRGGKKQTADLTLGKRTPPDLPPSAEALAAKAREVYAAVNAELQAAARDLPEGKAETRPAPAEWNFKELLAHYIACERDQQAWIASMLRDGNWQGQLDDSLEFRPNVTERLDAIVARYPTVPALLEELGRSQEETATIIAALPAGFLARKSFYNRLAQWMLSVVSTHPDEHREQMRALVA